jgi:hypothetical protein
MIKCCVVTCSAEAINLVAIQDIAEYFCEEHTDFVNGDFIEDVGPVLVQKITGDSSEASPT